MRLKKLNYKTAFYFIWAFYSVTYIMAKATELSFMYDLTVFNRTVSYATIFMLIILYISSLKFKKVEFIKHIIFVLLIGLIEINISDKNFLILSLFILCFRNLSFKELVEFDFNIKLILLAVILLLYKTGKIDNYSTIINGNYKNSYGFSHPNTFSCYIYTILLELMYIRFDILNYKDWMLQLFVSFLTLKYGGGRSTGYAYFLILFLFFIARTFPRIYITKFSYFMFSVLPSLLAILSFAAVDLYNHGNKIIIEINNILTSRISSASKFLNLYGIKLFGQEIETISSRMAKLLSIKSMILDCAYVRCGIMYGLLFLIIFCIAYSLMLREFLKNSNIDLALFATYFLIIGIGESYLLNPVYNLSLFFLINVSNVLKHEKNGSVLYL